MNWLALHQRMMILWLWTTVDDSGCKSLFKSVGIDASSMWDTTIFGSIATYSCNWGVDNTNPSQVGITMCCIICIIH